MQRLLLETADLKGVSSWLTVIPSSQHATVLNKGDFKDAICIRYGLPLDGLPSHCACGETTTTAHALTCPVGGYPTARHNEIRDLISGVMREVSQDVEVEPTLLPYQEETLPGRSANRAEAARVDIRAGGFWTRQQDAFFDVRVTHPKASALSRPDVLRHLREHENAKKRQYCQRVINVDRGSFTPLVFSTSGMCAKECSLFLKALARAIVDKHSDLKYSAVMERLRCKLSFSLLRWCITCFRGSRTRRTRLRQLGFVHECRQLSGHP